MAGHNEAVVLSLVRVRIDFFCAIWVRIRFSAKGSGIGALRNLSRRFGMRVFFRPILSCHGRDTPLGLCGRVFSVPFLPTRLGEEPK
jgi:hypothetical protein